MKNAIFKFSVFLILAINLNAFAQTDLSSQEIKDLKYMLEEEKLARDTYEYLDATWNMRVFNNIKISEQYHMDLIAYLLNSNKISYQLSDKQGVFYNEHLQKLYLEFIDKGSQSERNALEIGKAIELLDIDDLEKAKKRTSNSEIQDVYSKLIFASNNHLRAFNRNLSKFQNQ